jgi:hypothetical protein
MPPTADPVPPAAAAQLAARVGRLLLTNGADTAHAIDAIGARG